MTAPIRDRNDPRPTLLPHRVGSVMARASTPGVVMYDPVYACVVVADGTRWIPLSAASGVMSFTSAADGDAIGSGQTKLPLNGGSSTAFSILVDDATDTFHLLRGLYEISAQVSLSKASADPATAVVYLAKASDLTIPVAGAISNPVYIQSSQDNVAATLQGVIEVETADDYCLVLSTGSTNLSLGKHTGLSGIASTLVSVSLSLKGLLE